MKSLVEELRENPWFGALDPPLFRKLLDIASVMEWYEGEVLFREGDIGDHLFLIAEGQVALQRYVPGPGRITILTLGENEVFGWSAVMPIVGRRTTSAYAVIPTRAIAFDSAALRQACSDDHELGYHVYRRLTNILAARLTATRLQLLDMYTNASE